MKYFKKSKQNFSRLYISVFLTIFICLIFIFRGQIYRSLVTINLGGLYVQLLSEKSELISYLKSEKDIGTVFLQMSSNNYVKMQQERSKMVSNYVINASQWSNSNNYFKTKYTYNKNTTNAEIRLFGMNPDHFRSTNGHSFRIKFDGEVGYGKKKANFLNLRSRDYITDPLLNILFERLYDGIKISYKPYRVILNKASYGIFYKEDFFDNYLIEENKRRESLIFEALNDSLNFNFKGQDDSFNTMALELNNLYQTNYPEFLKLIDIDKLKSVVKLSVLINDSHPLSDINMHWYFNPVISKIEPTIREGFIKKIDTIDILNIISNNKIISDLLSDINLSDFENDLRNDLLKMDSIIKNDKEYKNLKDKLLGFKNEINKKEKLFINNLEYLDNNLAKKTNSDIYPKDLYIIKNDTLISENFIVPSNKKLVIKEGVTIKLKNSLIEIFGELLAIGNKKNQINIVGFSSNESGTILFNRSNGVMLDYLNFNNLTNSHTNFSQPASIIFYESKNININNSSFTNNQNGDDYINFFRSDNIKINNTLFQNIVSDAIDSDFSNNIIISNSKFIKIGNDAIDGSDSKINIKNSFFKFVLDKGISAGEKSNIEIEDSVFQENEIALVTKDESNLVVKNNTLFNNKLDFASYRKKRFFDLPSASFENTLISKYLIEINSKIRGFEVSKFSTNVESQLYGNLYGRATE